MHASWLCGFSSYKYKLCNSVSGSWLLILKDKICISRERFQETIQAGKIWRGFGFVWPSHCYWLQESNISLQQECGFDKLGKVSAGNCWVWGSYQVGAFLWQSPHPFSNNLFQVLNNNNYHVYASFNLLWTSINKRGLYAVMFVLLFITKLIIFLL